MTPRELVEAHLPLVQAIAYRMKRNLLTGADLDDLVGWGSLALCQAATRYRPGDKSFAGFAFNRIRWAMIDWFRRDARLPRRYPFDEESDAEASADRGYSRTGTLVKDVEDEMVSVDERLALWEAVAALPERERELVAAVDLRGRSVEEAGRQIGVSKGWASKLRKGALEVVRERLERQRLS